MKLLYSIKMGIHKFLRAVFSLMALLPGIGILILIFALPIFWYNILDIGVRVVLICSCIEYFKWWNRNV